jgi:hypothetical protein
MLHGIQPKGPGGCSGEWWCSSPTRLLQNLEAARLHTESSDTLYSVEAQTSTRGCGANYPPLADQSAQRTLEDVSPESQNTRNPSPTGGGAEGVLPHGVHHSLPASSSAHSGWPTANR